MAASRTRGQVPSWLWNCSRPGEKRQGGRVEGGHFLQLTWTRRPEEGWNHFQEMEGRSCWLNKYWLSISCMWSTFLSTGDRSVRGFPGDSVVKNLPAMQKTQETWVRSLGWEGPLEEGVATHSSILAWKIPWTEDPGGLQSMQFQRVVHDWNCWAYTHVDQ